MLLIGANFGAGDKEPRVLLVSVHLVGNLAHLSGPQSIAVKTGDGQSSIPAIVTFVKPSEPVVVTSWRLVPSGLGYEYKEFGPCPVRCEANWMLHGHIDATLTVPGGWELAAELQRLGSSAWAPGWCLPWHSRNRRVGHHSTPGRDGVQYWQIAEQQSAKPFSIDIPPQGGS